MYLKENIKNNLKNNIQKSIEKSVENNVLNINLEELPEIILEVPREKERGDFATTIAMHLPKLAKRAPRDIAQAIVDNLDTESLPLKSVEIAGPGFINFTLEPNYIGAVIPEILSNKENYGTTDINEGKTYNVEYISANPTGPMHIGNARGGAIGDVLASIAQRTGYDVTREFYVNDAGNQIVKFGDSLEARFWELMGEELNLPEDAYQGLDIKERVEDILGELSPEEIEELKSKDIQDRKDFLIEKALKLNIDKMVEDLEKYGIQYDVWFSEQSLYDNKDIEQALELLEKSGSTYEKDGAIWFKSTDYGLDKDDVLVRNNGIPTYYLGDIAYHINKFKTRGFDKGINVWGADHYGHIARLKKALEAAGITDRLEVITMQLVKLKKNDENIRMSKRAGNIYTLSDLIGEIGKDATRFFFNLRSPESQFEFDLDLAIEESNENPVFYVQYAHARIASILRRLMENEELDFSKANTDLLVEKDELELMNLLADFPEEIILAQETLDPSRITKYAVDLASAFHSFYNTCRVDIEDSELKLARAALIEATKQVLENVSDILGIEAPELM